MSSKSSVSPAKRLKFIMSRFANAKLEGAEHGFDIAFVDRDQNMEHFYIALKPHHGLYKDQWQILEMKTMFGSNVKYVYPDCAPNIHFITPVWHTNVERQGAICLDILKQTDKWQNCYSFTNVMENLIQLYQDPNDSSPFNGQASKEHVAAYQKFKSMKRKGMTVAEEEKVKQAAYVGFKKSVDAHAWPTAKIAAAYGKWFPQICLEAGLTPPKGALEEAEMNLTIATSIVAKEKAKEAKRKAKFKKQEAESKAKNINKWAARRAAKKSSSKPPASEEKKEVKVSPESPDEPSINTLTTELEKISVSKTSPKQEPSLGTNLNTVTNDSSPK